MFQLIYINLHLAKLLEADGNLYRFFTKSAEEIPDYFLNCNFMAQPIIYSMVQKSEASAHFCLYL